MADEKAPISFKSGSTSSKKWKKSNFIFFGGIMGLVFLISILIVFGVVFPILKNMDEISNLQEKLEFEGENFKSLESQLKIAKSVIFSQKSQIQTREQEISNLQEKLEFEGENFKSLETQLKSAKSVIFSQKSQIETQEQENEILKGKFESQVENVKSLESQLKLEIETRKKEKEENQALREIWGGGKFNIVVNKNNICFARGRRER